MTVPSRADARKFMAQLIKSESQLVQAVYDYRAEDFEGISPVILVTSSGATRPRTTFQGNKTTMYIAVELFVLYADPDANPPWTASESEDMLDALEQEVAQTLTENQKSGPWQSVTYEERSLVTRVVVGGSTYLYEVLPIYVEVF